MAVRETSRSIWLDLQGPLSLHISHKNRDWFAPGYLEDLARHEVEVRGWIRPARNGLRMNILHPASVSRISRTE
jgi:hypothetical protein